jgi:hypothetical protein
MACPICPSTRIRKSPTRKDAQTLYYRYHCLYRYRKSFLLILEPLLRFATATSIVIPLSTNKSTAKFRSKTFPAPKSENPRSYYIASINRHNEKQSIGMNMHYTPTPSSSQCRYPIPNTRNPNTNTAPTKVRSKNLTI